MAILLISGCARTLQMEVIREGLPPTVLVERLPLVVGAYYAPEFRAYRSQGDVDFPLGEASVVLFDRALAAMFDQVVKLADPPPAPHRERELAAVIAPRVQSVVAKFPDRVAVTYEIKVWFPQRGELPAWTVSGTGGEVYGAASGAELRDAVASALRSAVAEFVVGFRDQPDIRNWLASRGLGTRGGPRDAAPAVR